MQVRLGDWLVDEEANVLRRGGEVVRLENRVMAVLMQLVAADGGVVSKDALIESVWNGLVVSDHSVANAISELRKALGDDRRNPRYIETISKRGYRLIAPVAAPDEAAPALSDDAAPMSSMRRRLMPAIAIAAALALAGVALLLRPAGPPALYLVDAVNQSGEAALDDRALWAAEMLPDRLAGGNYRLVRWRRSDAPPRGLRKKDRLLTVSFVRDGDTPVISFQLSGRAGEIHWAEIYPVGKTPFSALAGAAARDLSALLGLPANSAASPVEPELLEHYWRARYLWSLREHDALRDAMRILEALTQRVPDFAPAYAAIADIYAHKTAEEIAIPRVLTFQRAAENLDRALALDPALIEAQITQSFLLFFRDRDRRRALAQIDAVIEQAPDNALAWQTKAMIESASGAASASLKSAAQARTLDPLSPSLRWDEVWFLYNAGKTEAALSAYDAAAAVSAPVPVYEALIHMARGDDAAALSAWLARARSRGADAGVLHDIAGRAARETQKAALAGVAALDYGEAPAARAALLAYLGDRDAAIAEMLGYRAEEKSWWLMWLDTAPAFATIADDPRLAPLRPGASPASGGL